MNVKVQHRETMAKNLYGIKNYESLGTLNSKYSRIPQLSQIIEKLLLCLR